MADLQQTMNEAHVSILDADAGVRALTGRNSGNCLPWTDTTDAQLPTLMYQPVTLVLEKGGIPNHWHADFQLDAFATGNGAAKKVNDLIDAALKALTPAALKAAGVDGTILRYVRQAWPPQDQKSKSSSRLTARATLTITYRVFA
jgi:hypothetical protein